MKIEEVARDRSLVSPSLRPADRAVRTAFVVVRLRGMLRADPSLRDPGNPNELNPAKRAQVVAQLGTEIPKAEAAYTAIWSRVNADAAANKLLPLDGPAGVDPRIRARCLHLLRLRPPEIRNRIVFTVVWRAVATHPALLDPARIEALHLLVDRRLRTVERMLYHVGRVSFVAKNFPSQGRTWRITTAPVAWKDGWNRIFEYPRIPKVPFEAMCNPAPGGTSHPCQNAAMSDWWLHEGASELSHDTQLNDEAAKSWQRPTPPDPSHYIFYFKKGAPGPDGDPAVAIERLFTPSDDFRKRNLLYCNHVVHALHLEALLSARKKRNSDTSWLTTLVNGKPEGWLRVDLSWGHAAPYDGPYLVEDDGTFFEHVRAHMSELQVGDQVIVYNHPAYDTTSDTTVMRLEDSVVVQVYPRLLLQGHGTTPKTIEAMKNSLIGLFNNQLTRIRELVGDRPPAAGGTIQVSRRGQVIRRVDPGASRYAAPGATGIDHRRADWWLRWFLDPEKSEAAVMADPAWRAAVQREQRIEYGTFLDPLGVTHTVGYFPLWEPQLEGGKPVTNSAGKITKTQRVMVTTRMVAGWTWFMPQQPADKDMLSVIRPIEAP